MDLFFGDESGGGDSFTTTQSEAEEEKVLPQPPVDEENAASRVVESVDDEALTRELFGEGGVVRVLTSSKGGRGVFAMRTLEAGCLIVAEEPLIGWEASLRQRMELVGVSSASNERSWTRHFHPRTLDDVSPDVVTEASRVYGPKNLRLALVFQFNAFDSGLFARHALFNHACGYSANCVRIDKKSGFSGIQDDNVARIFVSRRIEKGEELTLGYEQPCETATCKRLSRLRARYDFVCHCETCRGASDKEESAVENDVLALERSQGCDFGRIDRVVDRARRALGNDAPLSVRAMRLAFNVALIRVATLSHEQEQNDLVERATFSRALAEAHSRGNVLLNTQIRVLGPDHIDIASTASALADVLAAADARNICVGATSDVDQKHFRSVADRIHNLYACDGLLPAEPQQQQQHLINNKFCAEII